MLLSSETDGSFRLIKNIYGSRVTGTGEIFGLRALRHFGALQIRRYTVFFETHINWVSWFIAMRAYFYIFATPSWNKFRIYFKLVFLVTRLIEMGHKLVFVLRKKEISFLLYEYRKCFVDVRKRHH